MTDPRPILALILAILPAPATYAADWALRDGDAPFSRDDLTARLDGQSLGFFDGGTSVYGPGADYAYVYSDGDSVPGEYKVTEQGEVCIAFRNGASRCDLYVMNNGRMVLIDKKGDRYPVR